MDDIYKTLNTPGKLFAYWRTLPDMQEFVRKCYYDEVQNAANRFYLSEEFAEVQRLVHRYLKTDSRKLLDIGGGNGFATLAWEKAGYESVLVEPDDDPIVGYGAIQPLIDGNQTRVRVLHTYGENVPLPDESFDVIYVRQVLHHIPDLPTFMREVYRLLKHGGVFIATREHVISKPEDKAEFFERHNLHKYTQGENAYTLREYLDSMKTNNLVVREAFRYSVMNYMPNDTMTFKQLTAKKFKFLGKPLANFIANNSITFAMIQKLVEWQDNTPGRMYSFVAIKP